MRVEAALGRPVTPEPPPDTLLRQHVPLALASGWYRAQSLAARGHDEEAADLIAEVRALARERGFLARTRRLHASRRALPEGDSPRLPWERRAGYTGGVSARTEEQWKLSTERLTELSRELLRHWRGDLSQLELSVALGFSSNVVSHWESGRRSPRASVALRALDEADPDALRRMAALFGPWSEGIEPASREGVALMVGDALESVRPSYAIELLGVDRSTIARWMSGSLEPRIHELLGCFAVAIRLGQVLEIIGLGDAALVEMVATAPVGDLGPADWQVLHALELDAYRARPTHSTAWLASCLVLTPTEVERALQTLSAVGLIEPVGGRWAPTKGLSDIRPGEMSHEMTRALREDAGRKLASTASARWFIAHAHCSVAEAARVKAVLKKAYLETCQILGRSESKESLVQLSLALIALDGKSLDEF